ncbi:MAG: hypothetical protein ACKOA9_09480 [Actinomycetota bacterium]
MTGGRVRRLGGVAGLGAALLVVVGWFLVPPHPPGPAATAEEVVRWTLDGRRRLLVGSLCIVIGLALMIVFVAALRALCARAEGAPGILATIGWGSVLVALSVVFVGIALAQAQSFVVLDGDPGVVEALHEARLLLVDLAGAPLAVGLCAFGLTMWRSRYPARWLGGLAGVAAVAQLLGVGALSRDGFFSPSGGASLAGLAGLTVWVAVASVVLLVGPDPE